MVMDPPVHLTIYHLSQGVSFFKLIQETRERIKEDMAKRQTTKEQLLKATRITVSIVIKAGSFRLNEDVFAAHQQTENLKR